MTCEKLFDLEKTLETLPNGSELPPKACDRPVA
jgi:hypothetical protein